MSKEIQCKCCKEYWWETDIHSKSGLCPNCYDYFANLEAKLAESKEQLIAMNEKSNKIKKESYYLKQQLAESEKKVNEFHDKLLDEIQNRCDREVELTNCLNDVVDERYQLKQSQNQTAIRELEKVKVKLNEEINNVSVLLDPVEYEDYHELLGVIRGYKLSVDQIDQQIKELKGEV